MRARRSRRRPASSFASILHIHVTPLELQFNASLYIYSRLSALTNTMTMNADYAFLSTNFSYCAIAAAIAQYLAPRQRKYQSLWLVSHRELQNVEKLVCQQVCRYRAF